ncbi:ABC transporter ATP-binding protein [Acrocarpospora catenulata]|uniref:ABC transporter ATP-binding protein n=1 Tax=Acrocarpospora catenulata TaxID=2836182 RepID=UPI001BD94843|nr:ABC transporter ATP-binding protein [Acrocarpospora catenulata]
MIPRLGFGLAAAVCAALLGLAIPQALRWIVNDTLTGGGERRLWLGVAVVAALGIGEAALIVTRRRTLVGPGTRLESDLRVLLFSHLSDLPLSVHGRYSGGQLLSRTISDVRRFRRWLIFGLSQTCVNAITIVAGVVLILWIDWVLGLVYLVGSVPALALSFRARGRYAVLSRRAQDQAGDLAATVEEAVHGIRVLKAFGRERDALDGFTERAGALRRTELGKAGQRAVMTFAVTGVPDILLAALLFAGLHEISTGDLTVGGLLAIFTLTAVMGGPLERLSEQFAVSMEAKTALDRFLELLDHRRGIADPAQPRPVPDGRGQVVFDRVSFSYDGTQPLLRDVDLVIEPGETLALVGLTGSGKSAIGQLIPRFWEASAGAVRIDGVDVRELRRHDLRRLVAVAFEEPVLFSASVRANVTLGAPEATDEELWEALEIAHADFVRELPDGLDTRIGEEGMSLSGGQRQRLSLARAILCRPRVLVLDDPLSALDVHTEAAVSRRLRTRLAGTTTLLIAGRLSSIALADRVAVLHGGRIVATGTHDDLAAGSAVYRSIVYGEPHAAARPAPTVVGT